MRHGLPASASLFAEWRNCLRGDVQSLRFLSRAGVREEGWFGTRPTGTCPRDANDGRIRTIWHQPAVVAPAMASVEASKLTRDDVFVKARRSPRRNLPRRIQRSNHAHAGASLVNHVVNVVSSACSDVSPDKTVSLSTYNQLTSARMIRACTICC
jgi:hypothetical protein